MDSDLVVIFGSIVMIVLGLPVVVALSRRLSNSARSAPPTELPSDVTDRLQRIEQMMEATQIEVERISEGQRFTTKLLADRAAAPNDRAAVPKQ